MSLSTSPSDRRRVVIGSIAGILVLVIGIIAWRALANRQPDLDASPEEIRRFVASDEFKRLPQDQKLQYVDAMHRKFEPGEQQERAIRNMADVHRQQLLDEYFALPEGKARAAYLDKKIDEMERIRKMMDNPTTQPGQRVVIKRGGPSAAAQKEMAETIPAEQQAKMAQYVADMKARRAARGLPADGPVGIMIRVQR